MNKNRNSEANIARLILDEKISFSGKAFRVLENEYILKKVGSVLDTKREFRTSDHIGRIDFIVNFAKKKYAVELKSPVCRKIGNVSFYSAIKVLAYCAYYKFQTNETIFPSILFPKQDLTLEMEIIANFLKIKLFLFYFDFNEDLIIETTH